jgi:uncharacterized cupin superfamily protein
MARYAVRNLDDVPSIDDEGVDWKPLQHFFRLTAFGVNVYRAAEPGVVLIGDHDEAAGGHEELYVVLGGSVAFTVDGTTHDCPAGTVVAITDPSVRRSAAAASADSAVLAIGNRAAGRFESTWLPHHFESVPTIDD